MKRLSSSFLLAVVLLSPALPAHARRHHHSNYAHVQKQAQKNWEKYAKHEAKIQRKQQKAAEKAAREYNKHHHALSTTG